MNWNIIFGIFGGLFLGYLLGRWAVNSDLRRAYKKEWKLADQYFHEIQDLREKFDARGKLLVAYEQKLTQAIQDVADRQAFIEMVTPILNSLVESYQRKGGADIANVE